MSVLYLCHGVTFYYRGVPLNVRLTENATLLEGHIYGERTPILRYIQYRYLASTTIRSHLVHFGMHGLCHDVAHCWFEIP